MRTTITIAAGLAVFIGQTALQAAPTSMMNCLPKTEEAKAGPSASMPNWLTKWFRGPKAVETATTTITAPTAPPAFRTGGAPVAAYMPPQAVGQPASTGAVAAWQPAGPQTPAATAAPAAMPSLPTLVASTPVAARASVAGDVKKLRELGHENDRAGELAAAEQLYRQAIGVDPTSAAAVNDLALCLARQGKLDTSVATLEQAIRMRPDKPLYRNNIATVLVELNRTEEALAHLKAAYGEAAAHHNLGQLFARRGKTGLAIQHLQTAVQLEPSLGPAHQALARLAPTAPVVDTPLSAPTSVAASPAVAPRVAAYAPAPAAQSPPTVAVPATPQAPVEAGVPSFPRLLPPVLGQ